MNILPDDVFHVKVKFSGDQKVVELFNTILGDLDADWPWADNQPPTRVCKCCGGAEYVNPRFGVRDIRALATQLTGLAMLPGTMKVKIKSFRKAIECAGEIAKATGGK